MTDEERVEALLRLTSLWQESGDVERWVLSNEELMQSELPKIMKTWQNYISAKQQVSIVAWGMIGKTISDRQQLMETGLKKE